MENRNLERVRYWQGQLLRSSDFNRIHEVEEQRRWWHNRALHDAYGIHQEADPDPSIPRDFEVKLSADGSAALVAAGLAYDSFGRELILETDQTVPLPPITATDEDFTLAVRYRVKARSDDGFGALCARSGTAPEFVEFAWKPKHLCSLGDGFPLADVKIYKGARSLKVIPRQSSRPLARPLLASGATVPGNTPWELWTEGTGPNREPVVFGVQTTIDTSVAGFTDSPCYFAWLQGPVFNPQAQQLLPVLFPSLAEERVNSFVFRIPLPTPEQQAIAMLGLATQQTVPFVNTNEFPLFAHKQGLYVSWIGCQKNAAAPVITKLLLQTPALLLQLASIRSSLSPDLTVLATVLEHFNKL